jgi:hypothetical protein
MLNKKPNPPNEININNVKPLEIPMSIFKKSVRANKNEIK